MRGIRGMRKCLDSANALRLARWFVDSVMPGIGRLSVGIGFSDGWRLLLVPRVMLRRADLAAVLGYYAQARVWYDRVLDLWAEADPELRPAVEGDPGATHGTGRALSRTFLRPAVGLGPGTLAAQNRKGPARLCGALLLSA